MGGVPCWAGTEFKRLGKQLQKNGAAENTSVFTQAQSQDPGCPEAPRQGVSEEPPPPPQTGIFWLSGRISAQKLEERGVLRASSTSHACLCGPNVTGEVASATKQQQQV